MLLELIPATVRMSSPLALVALGGVYSERSGVVNIGLEGMMLMGAFGYVIGTHASASPWIGLVIGIACGGGMGLLHAIASITFRADQIVSGVSINLLAVGITEFLGRSATSRRVDSLSHWDLPLIGSYSFVVYLTPILVIISQIILFRTVLGLRLCAAGESTEALDALGLSRSRQQYLGVVVSGLPRWDRRVPSGIRGALLHQGNDCRARICCIGSGHFW